MSPPLFLQCGVEWHLHRHHFCVVHMTSPPFICSVHTGLSFLLATLPRFANVFLCSSSSRELFLSSCQCYTIFLCTKTVSDLDFYHFLPSTGFGLCWDDALVVSCVGVFSLTGCTVIFVGILLFFYDVSYHFLFENNLCMSLQVWAIWLVGSVSVHL